MWKYILIIAFVIFAIREINLMNESLYIAPDTHKIVAEDRTVIGKVEQVIEKKILPKIKRKEETPKPPVKRAEQPPRQKEKHPEANTTEKVLPKPEEAAPNLSAIEEENRSASPKTTLPPSLEKVEEAIVKKTGKPLLLQKPKPVQQPKTSPRPKLQNKMPKVTQPENPQPPKSVTPATTQPKQHYPDRYKSAEERVKAILEEMRKGGD